jgi:hypothetical protein
MSYQNLVSKWRYKANNVIWTTLKEQGVTSGRDALALSDKDKKRIIKAISSAYPFGQKDGHPNKIWCSEVANILSGLNIKKKPDFKPEPKPDYRSRVLIDDPRQMRFL